MVLLTSHTVHFFWFAILANWAETHLDRPCWMVHGSSKVCLDLVAVHWGCPKRVPGKHRMRVSRLRPASLSFMGPSYQTLTLSAWAGFTAWRLGSTFLRERRRGSRQIPVTKRLYRKHLKQIKHTHESNNLKWWQFTPLSLYVSLSLYIYIYIGVLKCFTTDGLIDLGSYKQWMKR